MVPMEKYIIPDRSTEELLNNALKQSDLSHLKTLINKSETSLWMYLNNKSKIPVSVISSACSLLGIDFYDFLEGRKIVAGTHSSSIDIFSKKFFELTPLKASILGCIPTEAHLRLDAIHIEISQNTDKPLEILKNLIIKEYPNVNPSNMSITLYNPPYFQLKIKSPYLRWLFEWHYGIQAGNGSRTREVPYQILDSNNDKIILGFLSGVFSLEGCFSVYKQDNKAIISLEMSSKSFVSTIRELLKNRGYKVSAIKPDRGCWRFTINNMNDNVRLLYELLPWFLHERKLIVPRKSERAFLEVMRTFMDRIHFSNDKVKELIKKCRDKCGSSYKLINQINSKFDTKLNIRKANRWLYENEKLTLRVIWYLSQIAQINTVSLFKENIIPEYYSLLFLINKLLTKEEFEGIRREKLLINL